jgi:hypothetical protein
MKGSYDAISHEPGKPELKSALGVSERVLAGTNGTWRR